MLPVKIPLMGQLIRTWPKASMGVAIVRFTQLKRLKSWHRWFVAKLGQEILSFAWVPARSASGPMRFPANWRPSMARDPIDA
jgi:hypothetical protein